MDDVDRLAVVNKHLANAENDLHATMDTIHEIAILSGEVLPPFIDAMEALCEKYPNLLKKAEGKDNGVKRLQRLWAYTRMASLQMNDLQKHYGFESDGERIEFSFPVKDMPEDLKELFRECMPPEDWAEEEKLP